MTAWVSEMRLHEPHREHVSVGGQLLGRPDDELTVIDTSDVLAVRERAIACHLSQASPFDSLPPALRRRFLTTDHVVEVESAEPVGRFASAPGHTHHHNQHRTGEHS
jgi:hypothetical protein